ncbi:hypothetical protein K488DRAFT_79931 [Vararia minispora EC-137]|uniref:Uncharacterized protein n=1 Tax=Vararia minispora EC-137 TaxID=1314806 RepID=A0ACB8QDG7_9AGAM|nr:hypothetical protein K488DRAFT_79931 [Vararia minispora EC-137]
MPLPGLARNGWHPGEIAIQTKLGCGESEQLKTMWHEIKDHMSDQFRLFFLSEIPFMPLTTLDNAGRRCHYLPAATAPLWEKEKDARDPYRYLVAGVGVQWWSRRRNKIAGRVRSARICGFDLQLDLEVDQGVGSFPKYINVRDVVPNPNTNPCAEQRILEMKTSDGLPQNRRHVLVASIYKARPGDAANYPSHAGLNHRLPGFARITSLAGLTIASWTTIIIGKRALSIMPRQAAITAVTTTGYVLVRDALPVQQRKGSEEESSGTNFRPDEAPTAHLLRIVIHARDIATFDLESVDKPVAIRPGQAVALSSERAIAKSQRSLMASNAPRSLNNDRVRMWTVSSAHEVETARPSGLVTTTRREPGLARGQPPILSAAGGIMIGVTPFMSMLAALAARGLETKADVVIALTTREPDVFVPLVRVWSGRSSPVGVRVRLDIFTNVVEPDPKLTRPNATEMWYKGRIPMEYWYVYDSL